MILPLPSGSIFLPLSLSRLPRLPRFNSRSCPAPLAIGQLAVTSVFILSPLSSDPRQAPKKCFVDFQPLTTIRKTDFAQKQTSFSRAIPLIIFATHCVPATFRQHHFARTVRTYMEGHVYYAQR